MALACRAEEDPTNCGEVWADLPDGMFHAEYDFAWQIPDAVYPTIYLDVASFTRNHDMDEAETSEAAELAVAYWNAAGANFTLSLDTETVVCGDANYDGTPVNDQTKDDCIDLNNGDSTVVLHHGYPSEAGVAYTYHEPSTVTRKDGDHLCTVAADTYFHDLGELCDETDLAFDLRWHVYQTVLDPPWNELCENGYQDKPFYNTFVHELGHVLGLDEATAEDSVMLQGCEACNFELIGATDIAAVSAMYPL